MSRLPGPGKKDDLPSVAWIIIVRGIEEEMD